MNREDIRAMELLAEQLQDLHAARQTLKRNGILLDSLAWNQIRNKIAQVTGELDKLEERFYGEDAK